MLMDTVLLLSSGGSGARMRILIWTNSHQMRADDIFQKGLLDAEVKVLDAMRVAFIWVA